MASKSASKRFKWSLDFNNKTSRSDLASPPGYNSSISQNHSEIARENDQNQTLIIKKSWEIALGPIKQVPMNLLIMYMSGNSISIFPIMMVGMMLIRKIKAIFSTSTTFKVIDGNQATGQKFVYFLGNIANLALAIYKCHSMQLLPTESSDWLAFVESQSRLEFFGGGVSML